MIDFIEKVISTQPFVVQRAIRWADCDPAGVAYAGRYPEYLIDAVMHFLSHLGYGIGNDGKWQTNPLGLPCKHMQLTFHTSLFPDDVVNIAIGVTGIRKRTFDIGAIARLPDGKLAFEGVFSPICVEPSSRTSTAIPTDLRRALELHVQPRRTPA